MSTFDDVLTDGVGMGESPLLTVWSADGDILVDAIGLVEFMDSIKAVLIVLTDGVGCGEELLTDSGVILTDQLNAGDVMAVNLIGQLTLGDGIALQETLQPGSVMALVDALTLTDALAQQLVLVLLDTLGLADALDAPALYQWSFSDTFQFVDSLGQFIGVDILDTLGLAETLLAPLVSPQVLTDGIGVAETLTPSLLLRVDLADGLDLSDAEAVQALYTGVLQDGIELSAAYLAPDGSFTTWTLNTHTAAVTEYQNYQFNSFAQIGDRYVGASSTGLYWLDGDTDAGADIVARMKGGFLQFGGTHLSRLQAAYIATRSDTEFVLKIETGDGVTYNYAVSTRSMRSTKVHMGKGQRARYFRYELISTGDDFDLDTLEFVPVVMQRRV